MDTYFIKGARGKKTKQKNTNKKENYFDLINGYILIA